MLITIDLPEDLLKEAMKLAKTSTKTDVIKLALEILIRDERAKCLKSNYGKIDLDIELDDLRKRC